MVKMHTIKHPVDDDKLTFINYNDYGVTVAINYSGEMFDFGFSRDELPALIKWLQKVQKGD